MSNFYEQFRTVLTMNLCQILPADQLRTVLDAVDISMDGYEISKKQVEIIPAIGIPEVVKLYVASKAIANLSKGTLKQYNFKLQHFFNTVRKSYTDIRANDIRLYLYNFKTEHNASDAYVESIRVTLSGFFRWLVDNEYLQRNPCAKVEQIRYQQKERIPLTDSELELVRLNATKHREKALIDFLYSTGCRVSECADVRLSDIDWTKRSVRIRHGKGNKARTTYFNAEAEVSLKEYLATRSDSTDALFVSCRAPYRAIGSHALENIIKAVGDRCGLHVFPHRLRHTFATAGLNSGMPLHMLQQLLGHENPETTLIYAKQDQTDLQLRHRRAYA